MERQGAKTLRDVWPNLELFIHGGISFKPYREQYKALCPGQMNFMETYNASEGFFGLQDDPEDANMLLMLDYGNFYEFLPLDELGQEHPQGIVPLWGVQPEVDYAMVISSVNGLWRYMIGDTIRFASTNPYKFTISGRTKLFINAFGEELMISNAEAAMTKACEQTGLGERLHRRACVYGPELTRTPRVDSGVLHAAHRPRGLRRSSRQSLARGQLGLRGQKVQRHNLGPPQTAHTLAGLFAQWLSKHGKMGGQNKVPRLKNDRSIMDELLTMM